jgi:hypothetical protein
LVHVKVILNHNKIGDYILTKGVRLRKLIPDLEPLKLYSLNLLYKENGEYLQSDIRNFFLVVDEEKKLLILSPIYSLNRKYYLEIVKDFSLEGSATKKIVIQDTDYKFYDIHISSVHSESIDQKRIYDFNSSILLASNKNIDLQKELAKKLSKYIFQVKNIVCSDGCILDEDSQPFICESTNKIYIEVSLDRKKTWKERINEYFKYFFNW